MKKSKKEVMSLRTIFPFREHPPPLTRYNVSQRFGRNVGLGFCYAKNLIQPPLQTKIDILLAS